MAKISLNGLCVLSNNTLDDLWTHLERKKVLHTEDGYLRDYRGLIDHLGLEYEERLKVEASDNKAG